MARVTIQLTFEESHGTVRIYRGGIMTLSKPIAEVQPISPDPLQATINDAIEAIQREFGYDDLIAERAAK